MEPTTISELLDAKVEEMGSQAAVIRRLRELLKPQGGSVSRETFGKWLSGHSRPSDEYVPALAELLGRDQWDVVSRLVWERARKAGVTIDLGELRYAPVAQLVHRVPYARVA